MTEIYAHLAPENLIDAVSSIEDRLHFGSTATSDEQSPEDSNLQVIDKTDERWWARKDSNLRPMDYESTTLLRPLYKSITYAHRSHATVTQDDRNGLLTATFWWNYSDYNSATRNLGQQISVCYTDRNDAVTARHKDIPSLEEKA